MIDVFTLEFMDELMLDGRKELRMKEEVD
jgi:hypothetical protein